MDLATLRNADDRVADALLSQLEAAVRTGRRSPFLATFSPTLQSRVGKWFDNTVALGVAATHFVRMAGYYSDVDDRPTSFSRSAVLGIRTPFDDGDSMPGITYSVTFTRTAPGWLITAFLPSYVEDPMNCDCSLSVLRSGMMAVVAARYPSLTGWPELLLHNDSEGIAWLGRRLGGSGLTPAAGQVVFLADAPHHWFEPVTGPPDSSDATIPLIDADGSAPGRRYSRESRIVVTLRGSDGTLTEQNQSGQLYVDDTLTHESVHQLMNHNFRPDFDSANRIDTWAIEGIAVAVETLHRRDERIAPVDGLDPDASPQRDDPATVDGGWMVEHAQDGPPSRDDLEQSDPIERNRNYALAGSVYLFVAATVGFTAMLRVAAQVYGGQAQTPFDAFPDPDSPGRTLPAADAQSRWQHWVTATYGG